MNKSRLEKATEKAYWVLNTLSPGEIQAFASVKMPVKIGKDTIDAQGNRIYAEKTLRDLKIKSTGIPASTIARFQSREFTPRARSIKKLSDFYDRYTYHRLKAAGAKTSEARVMKKKDPETVRNLLRNYYTYARRISDNIRKTQGKHVPVYAIAYGMSLSKHTYDEWEQISRISGLGRYKAPRKRGPNKRKGYGYHRGG